jgi:hypothetical protein
MFVELVATEQPPAGIGGFDAARIDYVKNV